MVTAKTPTTQKLSDVQKANIKEAANKIGGSFDWSLTPDGYSYWSKVTNNLYEIANYKPKPKVTVKMTDSCPDATFDSIDEATKAIPALISAHGGSVTIIQSES